MPKNPLIGVHSSDPVQATKGQFHQFLKSALVWKLSQFFHSPLYLTLSYLFGKVSVSTRNFGAALVEGIAK